MLIKENTKIMEATHYIDNIFMNSSNFLKIFSTTFRENCIGSAHFASVVTHIFQYLRGMFVENTDQSYNFGRGKICSIFNDKSN